MSWMGIESRDVPSCVRLQWHSAGLQRARGLGSEGESYIEGHTRSLCSRSYRAKTILSPFPLQQKLSYWLRSFWVLFCPCSLPLKCIIIAILKIIAKEMILSFLLGLNQDIGLKTAMDVVRHPQRTE